MERVGIALKGLAEREQDVGASHAMSALTFDARSGELRVASHQERGGSIGKGRWAREVRAWYCWCCCLLERFIEHDVAS
jgi:hypothetical protein